jgi:antitoxin MazE
MVMRAAIRQIGNSKGVIIPASFLAEAGLQNEVEMSLYNHSIIITPVKKELRKGWFDGYDAADDEDAWNGFVALPGEEDEWVW